MDTRLAVTRGRDRLRFLSLPLAVVAGLGSIATTTRPLYAQTAPPGIVTRSVSVDDSGIAATAGTVVGPAHHPSRVLVKFRHGTKGGLLPGSGAAHAFPLDRDLYVVENPPGLSVAEAVQRYRRNPNVVYAEPDYVVHAVATPTDPRWGEQWDMLNIAAPTAWDSQTDSGDVVVVVIDTGIDFTHPDLQANLWNNPLDGSHGFTCMNGACAIGGADDFGHGTHVAGTIGASANNGIGIAGINWKVQLLSIKFLGSGGSGLISDAVLCFDQATSLKQQGFNIRVTSNSWGGGGFSQALKDAMARGEAAGMVHVCAAGNSAQNADVAPMYPAAYDNRGIVSVLASDQNNVGAGFTNYGLASVDIAAPGVNTLSTVPTATCTLCDPSGYKLLSGTSMATPHVSGVLAALFHQNPALTTNEARDVVLDPGSYDAVTDLKAQSTSTGGRLDFAKALGNPLLFAPILNRFPTLTMGPDVNASAGSQVNLSATASDLDNDPLRMSWARSVSTGSLWLFGWMLSTIFPNPTGNSVSFTAPFLARTGSVPYDASVADGRGGGAHGRSFVTVPPAPSPGQPPAGTLTVTPLSGPAPTTVSISYPATDPEGGPAVSDLWVAYQYGASGSCCYSGLNTSMTLNTGVYRIGTQAIDRELNFGSRPSAVVRIGGATGDPPAAAATFDKLSGPIPLTVSYDMSASTDQDGTIVYYFVNCNGGFFTPGSQSPLGSCTFTTPGSYWIMMQVQDNNGYMDLISAYAVATPPPSNDTTAPTVSITSPLPGADVSGNVPVIADASDASGISKVDFYRDVGILLGTANSAPYGITWDAGTVAPGSHTLYAVATDNAGNPGTSASIGVTVQAATPPLVSITSPVNNAIVARKSTVTILASASPTSYQVSRVDLLVNSKLVCSDATSPYSCDWRVPAGNRTYTLSANAYDVKGTVGVSNAVNVTAK